MNQTRKDKDLVPSPQVGATEIQPQCRFMIDLFEPSRSEDKDKAGLIMAYSMQVGNSTAAQTDGQLRHVNTDQKNQHEDPSTAPPHLFLIRRVVSQMLIGC